MKLLKIFVFLAPIFIPAISFAWDGYDTDTGNDIEIEKGNLVRQGQEIEYYDYESGEYRQGEVQSIQNTGSGTEIELYDYDSDDYRTFDMN